MAGSTILQICQPLFRDHNSYNEFYFVFYVFKLKIILYQGYLYQFESKWLVLQFYKFVNPRLRIIIHIIHNSYNEFYFDFYVFKLKIILYWGYLYQHQSKLLVLQFYKFVNPRLGITIHIMNFILFSMYSKKK